MKWSFKLGRFLGIDVYIHATFLLLMAFVGVAHWLTDQTIGSALAGILFFSALFLCVLLHEYGHALAARGYGIRTQDITLLPIGGLARLERMPEKPSQELWVALAGPLVNVVIATGLAVGLALAGRWEPISSLGTTSGSFAQRLLAVNVLLVVFNMLPAFPMDGGRVLRALLASRLEYARATRIAATVGQGMALLFGLAGLFYNPMLLLIAVFVWFGASQEAAAAEMKSSFAGATVREAMLTDFRTLSGETRIGEAGRLLLAGTQRDFPVVDSAGRLIGVLIHTDLFRALREQGEDAQVAEVMRKELELLQVDESLDAALSRASVERSAIMPVFQGANMVGLLTPENLGEYMMIRSALARRRATPPPLPVSGRRVPPVIPPPLLWKPTSENRAG